MSLLPKSERRAESARINGAKSTGPSTPEGLNRARTAPLQHGLYAAMETLNATVDPAIYDTLCRNFQRIWGTEDEYTATRVDELAHAHCVLTRLQRVLRIRMSEMFSELGSVYDVELASSMPGNIVFRLEARIRRQQLTVSRIERDLFRLKKQAKEEGWSHKVLETHEPEVAPELCENPANAEVTPEPELETAPGEPNLAESEPVPEPPAGPTSCSDPDAPYYLQTVPPAHPPGPAC